MAAKWMVKLKIIHLKVAILVLPCLFIPLVLIYGKEKDNLAYLDVDARNAELFKRWLEQQNKMQHITIAPFQKSGDENNNAALFNHWSAHQGPGEELKLVPEKQRIFKRIIFDGVTEKVIVSEMKIETRNTTINKLEGILKSGVPIIRNENISAMKKIIPSLKSTQFPMTRKQKVPKKTTSAKRMPPPSKEILLWNEVFAKPGYLQFKKCPYRNCFITTDKAKLTSSHAVIFNMGGQTPVRHRELKELPRNPNQSWIFYQRESQLRPLTSDRAESFNGMFNLTMTFKRASNIWQPYYHFKLRPEVNRIKINFASGKTKLVAWLLGNCNENSIPSDRMTYFRKLQKNIAADLYSNCPGGKACDTDCISSIYKDYRFIFAAESAICSDFATAITWKPLTYNIVPIVLGGSNYSNLLPPKSFIDIRNFNSTEHLAKHLSEVAKSDTMYNSYFHWRKYYELGDSHVGFCKLCAYMHQNASKRIIQHKLESYWDKDKDCLTSEHYYQGHV